MRLKYAGMAAICALSCVWIPALIVSTTNIALFFIVYALFTAVAFVTAWAVWPPQRRTKSRMTVSGLLVVLICFVVYGATIGVVLDGGSAAFPANARAIWSIQTVTLLWDGIITVTIGGTLLTLGFPWWIAVSVSQSFADHVEGIGPLSGKWIETGANDDEAS